MAATVRPALLSGVALASTAALALAAPAALPLAAPDFPGVPGRAPLTSAQYELTALSDVSIAGLLQSFAVGWGGFIGPADVFYPGEFANDVLLNGFGGVAYYVVDQAVDGIVPLNLENYFFEVGSRSPGNEIYAGLGAAAYVGVGSVFGADSVPAQLVKALMGNGFDIGTTLVSLTAGVPVIGDLTSVYFTGMVTGDETVYGTGLAGVLAYAGTLFPTLLGGFDLTGLTAGVTSLVTSLGTLVSGVSGGNGGSASATAKSAAAQPDASPSISDVTATVTAADGPSGNGGEDSNGDAPSISPVTATPQAVTPTAAKPAAAPQVDLEAEAGAPAAAPEVSAETSADSAEQSAVAESPTKRSAKRSAEKSGASGHAVRGKSGRSAE